MDMLAAVHADQEGLIADLSEELSASRTHCAQLEAKIGNLCGPPHETGPRSLNRHHTRLDELEAHASHVTELKQELSQAQVKTPAPFRVRSYKSKESFHSPDVKVTRQNIVARFSAHPAVLRALMRDC